MFKRTVQKIKVFFIPCQENNYQARFLTSNFLFHYLLFLLVLKLLVLPIFVYLPRSIFFASLSKSILIDLTNQERQSLGLVTLNEDSFLNEAALQKAQDMLSSDYFGHISPEGKNPWYWFKQAGYKYQKAGENLAIGFLDAEEVFQAWNASYSHQENISNPNYEDVGIAVLKGDFQGQETTVIVQLFGSKPKEMPLIEGVQAKEEVSSVSGKEEIEAKAESKVEKEGREQIEPTKDSLEIKFFKFMSINYLDLIQKIIFYSSILIIGVLCFSIFTGINIQPKDLLVKAVFFILMFSLFAFLNKEVLLSLIPHNLNIN